MNDIECRVAYERLIDMLNQNKLEWIAAQVQEQVRLGKTVEKEIDTLKESRRGFDILTADDYPSRFMKGPKATFPVTVEYQPSERLILLLDAIEQAIVNTVEMEHHFIEYFSRETDNWQGIQFYSEDPDSRPVSINKETISFRLENGKRLKQLLDTLRKEAKQ